MRRRPWRNVLIATAVAITVAVLVGFFSVRSVIQHYLTLKDQAPYQRLFLKPRNLAAGDAEYPIAYKDKLAQIPGVKIVGYVRWLFHQTDDGVQILVMAGDPETLAVYKDIWNVDDETIQRWAKERTGAVVPNTLAKQFNLTLGKPWEIPMPKGSLRTTIVGFTELPHALVHWEYGDEFLGRTGVVSDFRLALDHGTDYRPVVKAADQLMKNFGAHLITEQTMMQLKGVNQSHVVPNLLAVLGLVLLVTTTLALANTTMISVRERRAEIATLRVIGVKRSTLALTIVSESIVICALGGVVGVLIAWLALRSGLSLGSTFLESLRVNKSGIGAGLAISVLIPMLGSTFAAWLAIRAPLSQALRDAA